METIMRRFKIRFLLMLSVVLLQWSVFPLVSYGAEPMEDEGKSTSTVITQKRRGPVLTGEQGYPLPDSKRNMVLVTSTGRYRITASTEVLGTAGQTISMDELPVPCEAWIVYQPLKRNDPNALRVEVKRILAGATKAWPESQPQ